MGVITLLSQFPRSRHTVSEQRHVQVGGPVQMLGAKRGPRRVSVFSSRRRFLRATSACAASAAACDNARAGLCHHRLGLLHAVDSTAQLEYVATSARVVVEFVLRPLLPRRLCLQEIRADRHEGDLMVAHAAGRQAAARCCIAESSRRACSHNPVRLTCCAKCAQRPGDVGCHCSTRLIALSRL